MILLLGYIAAAIIVWYVGVLLIAFTLEHINRKQDGMATMAVIVVFEIAWTALCIIGGTLYVGIQIGGAA